MDERSLQWRVGIVVLCAAVILAILIILFGEGWQSTYTLFVNTRTAPNVTRNTPVRKNGILIGRVSLVKNQDQGVLLTLKINRDETIYENEVCTIGTASFLGDAVLDFTPGTQPGLGSLLPDRAVVRNVLVERNPVELIDMALDLERQVADTLDAVKRGADTVDQAGQGIAEITSTFQEVLGDGEGDIRQFIADARILASRADQTLQNVNQLMVNLNDVVGDPEARDNLRETVARMPQILDDFNVTIRDTRETINGFRKVSESADRNLTNLEQFSEALGNDGPALIEGLEASLEKVNQLVNDASGFARSISQSEGTIGKLINDPELYNNLNDTLRNAREISIILQPLINDLRYAADGIARDPGQLGIRGALDRSPAFGKFKGTLTGSDRNER